MENKVLRPCIGDKPCIIPSSPASMCKYCETVFAAGAASRDGEIEAAKQEGRKEVVDFFMRQIIYEGELPHSLADTLLAQLKAWFPEKKGE